MHVLHLPPTDDASPAESPRGGGGHLPAEGRWLGIAPADAIRVVCLRGHALADGWDAHLHAPEGCTLVAWSGTLGGSLWEAHPLTWMNAGWSRLIAALTEIAPALRARGQRLVFRTHCWHVVSDVHAAQRFLGEAAAIDAAVFGVLPDPAAMLTAGMMPRAAEHLDRMAAHVPGLCGPLGVLVTGLQWSGRTTEPPEDDGADGSSLPGRVCLGEPSAIDVGPVVRACAAAGVRRYAIEGDRAADQAAALHRLMGE